MAQSPLILGRYKPLGTAGAGGFGTVRIAWDQRIQRKVAIKTIELSEIDARRAALPGADAVSNPPSEAQEPESWRGVQPWSEYLAETGSPWPGEVIESSRLAGESMQNGSAQLNEPVTALAHLPGLDEARTAAKLQDPRIVGVFDFEVRGQTAYLIMEYVEGITLTRLLAEYENYLTLDVIAAVFDAVAGALGVAHKAGVLHLDIKPDNILIDDEGRVKVTDFGLATLADASGTGLAGGGTIGYMPLEQMRREPLDARTDEWALASVTYEMLTGDNPFHADSLPHAEAAIEDAELILPSLCWENIDEQIDDVIFYALDPERDERYASVADFAEEADKFLGDAAKGKRQLAIIVQDALGMLGEEEDLEEGEDAPDDWVYDKSAPRHSAPLSRLTGTLGDFVEQRGGLEEWVGRIAIGIAACYLGFFAMDRIYMLAPILGRAAAPVISTICAAVVGICGIARPRIGILIASMLSGFALIAASQPVVGAVLIAAGLVWCYAFGQFALRDERPVLLTLVAAACVAGIAASLYFIPAAQDAATLPAAISVAASIIVHAITFAIARR